MRAIYLIPAAVVVLVLILSSVFIVDERKKALILQFGQVMQVKETPGLGFKVPLLQDVVLYEDRILGLQTQPIEVTLLSDRRLVEEPSRIISRFKGEFEKLLYLGLMLPLDDRPSVQTAENLLENFLDSS